MRYRIGGQSNKIFIILLLILLACSIAACDVIQQLDTYKDGIINKITTSSSQTITRQVSADSDDCMRYWNGSIWLLDYEGDLIVGHYDKNGTKFGLGLRFTKIPIPKSATITQANIKVISNYNASNTIVRSKISGELANNAANFTNQSDFEKRYGNRTKESVNWDNIEAWTKDVEYTSPDIKKVVQQIVNGSGWESGNAIVIFWEDFEGRSDATSEEIIRSSYSYDVNPASAAKLSISWNSSLSSPASSASEKSQESVSIPLVQIATTQNIYVGMFSLSLCVELKPTSQAKANYQYKVDLFEKGKLRASSSVIWNQPELNVKTVRIVYFPLTREEVDAYLRHRLDEIFSASVQE